MSPVGFEPAVAASERSQTHALDRAATGIGNQTIMPPYNHYITVTVIVIVCVKSHRVKMCWMQIVYKLTVKNCDTLRKILTYFEQDWQCAYNVTLERVRATISFFFFLTISITQHDCVYL
jgi:hypothetical protein